jgi:hypothetical protein
MMKSVRVAIPLLVIVGLLRPSPAAASLTEFQTFVGNVDVSTDGWGSISQAGQIQASVPVGATVLGAYLYTSTFSNPTLSGVGGTLAGAPVTYTSLGDNTSSCCSLTSGRMDVTSIIAPIVDGGPGGVYNFNITETDASQDGEALVVVYTQPSLPIATIGILDGFSAVGGDDSSINFNAPLDPSAPGFFAEMMIGDGFSCCGQASTISVNGTVITNEAGNDDDGGPSVDGFDANGNLITVGGFNDPDSPFLPTYAEDHERYTLVPEITAGDTSINVHTVNPSQDDNIFLEVFRASGEGGVDAPPPPPLNPNPVPEPGTLLLFGTGAIAAFKQLRSRILS